MLEESDGPFVIPIWNSHEGEVKAASYVWDSVESETIQIRDAWAKPIQFWFVRRSGSTLNTKKVVGSVTVAATQCSAFLKKNGYALDHRALTTTAFDEYKYGADWAGVLVAPGQGDGDQGFEIVTKETANDNNFTSFVQIVPGRLSSSEKSGTKSWLTGVKMSSFGDSLGDQEHEFFERLMSSVTSIENLPKLIFVFDRQAKVGLLFEGGRIHGADLLDAEQIETNEITIFENAGVLQNGYTKELSALFREVFPRLEDGDFILHQGVGTCLFACPPLGLYTHGYNVQAVEAVVRFYIGRLFELWDTVDLGCTDEQDAFFEKHLDEWRESRSEFIKFTVVSEN